MAIYLQEIAAIDRGGKEAYLEGIRTRWAPYAERTRGMKLVWLGSTVGTTSRWPETMALWELRDWDHWAEVCARAYTESSDDLELRAWWKDACKLRLRSRSQTLVGAPFSPTFAELQTKGTAGTVFAFASFRVASGRAPELLARLEHRVAADAAKGRDLIGAYEVALTPDRVHAIWGHRTLADLTAYEAGREAAPWSDDDVVDWTEHWGFATPGSPLWPKDYATGVKVW